MNYNETIMLNATIRKKIRANSEKLNRMPHKDTRLRMKLLSEQFELMESVDWDVTDKKKLSEMQGELW